MTLICPDIDQFVCLAERSLQAVPKASIINLFVYSGSESVTKVPTQHEMSSRLSLGAVLNSGI